MQRKMGRVETELEYGDLVTVLARTADRLRGYGLALNGLAYQDHEPGQNEFRVLIELAAGLEQEAVVIAMVGKMLCRSCKMAQIRYLAVSTLPSRGR